jgi:hypothetical protein
VICYNERTACQPYLPAIVARNQQENASGCDSSFGWARCLVSLAHPGRLQESDIWPVNGFLLTATLAQSLK